MLSIWSARHTALNLGRADVYSRVVRHKATPTGVGRAIEVLAVVSRFTDTV